MPNLNIQTSSAVSELVGFGFDVTSISVSLYPVNFRASRGASTHNLWYPVIPHKGDWSGYTSFGTPGYGIPDGINLTQVSRGVKINTYPQLSTSQNYVGNPSFSSKGSMDSVIVYGPNFDSDFRNFNVTHTNLIYDSRHNTGVTYVATPAELGASWWASKGFVVHLGTSDGDAFNQNAFYQTSCVTPYDLSHLSSEGIYCQDLLNKLNVSDLVCSGSGRWKKILLGAYTPNQFVWMRVSDGVLAMEDTLSSESVTTPHTRFAAAYSRPSTIKFYSQGSIIRRQDLAAPNPKIKVKFARKRWGAGSSIGVPMEEIYSDEYTPTMVTQVAGTSPLGAPTYRYFYQYSGDVPLPALASSETWISPVDILVTDSLVGQVGGFSAHFGSNQMEYSTRLSAGSDETNGTYAVGVGQKIGIVT